MDKQKEKIETFAKNWQYFGQGEWTVEQVAAEIDQGLALLNVIEQPLISVFGSHSATPASPDYLSCYRLSKKIAAEGYGILTGGGSGIPHAANKAAHDSNVPSVALWAKLLRHDEVEENIYTSKLNLTFIFVRRFLLSIESRALVFYPGGAGTLSELCEYINLMQTGIVDKVPVVCVGADYWNGLRNWLIEANRQRDYLMKDQQSLGLLTITDDPNLVFKVLAASK